MCSKPSSARTTANPEQPCPVGDLTHLTAVAAFRCVLDDVPDGISR